MATTYTLNNIVSYVSPFIRNVPLTFPNTNYPAILLGDWVRNTILQAPFAWRWNRAITSTTCSVGQTDYVISLPNFGWIEQASGKDTSVIPNTAFELGVQLTATQETTVAQPTLISPFLDDNAGDITFRLMPPPDKTYTLNIIYQNASPKFGTMNDTWAPIPDFMNSIVQQLYLAKAYEYVGDERFAASMQMGIRALVGASEGLTESQKNIFLDQFLATTLTKQNAALSSQFGNQSRSLS